MASYPLAMFRLLFGCVLIRFFWDLHNSSWVTEQFEEAVYWPAYSWIEGLVVTPFAIRLSLLVLLVSSVCFTIGLLYRLNCIVLLVFYSYIYLSDPTWCVNLSFCAHPLRPFCRQFSSLETILLTLIHLANPGPLRASTSFWC